MAKEITLEDYQALGNSHELTLIGEVPKNTKTRIEWLCSQKHVIKASYQDLRRRVGGCNICSRGSGRRLSFLDYEALAEKTGLSFVGTLPGYSTQATFWECQEGHRWKSSYKSIRQGARCPHCPKPKRKRRRIKPYNFNGSGQRCKTCGILLLAGEEVWCQVCKGEAPADIHGRLTDKSKYKGKTRFRE